MESIIIRRATVEDKPALLQFEQGIISAERPYDPALKAGAINYYDLGQMIAHPDTAFFVAVSNGQSVGCGYGRIELSKPISKYDRYLYLGFMYVNPEFRGLGVIQRIMEEIKKWGIANGIQELRLEVYSGNASAIKAYEKAGFEERVVEMRMELH